MWARLWKGHYRGPFTSCPVQAKAFCGPFDPTFKLSSNSVRKLGFFFILLSAINKRETHTENLSQVMVRSRGTMRENRDPQEN